LEHYLSQTKHKHEFKHEAITLEQAIDELSIHADTP